MESLRSIKDEIKGLVRGRVKFDEPMSRHTSFRIGGPADCWVEPEDLEDLKGILKFASDSCLPWKVLGGGTNILVRDKGFPGIIISLRGGYFQKLEFPEEKVDRKERELFQVRAGAGVLLSRLVGEAAERGLRGLEFAVGIPGTVGGAVVMNAGTPNNSLAEVVSEVEVLNGEGKVLTLRKNEMGFRYRGSNLSPRPPAGMYSPACACLPVRVNRTQTGPHADRHTGRVILKAKLKLKKGTRRESQNLVNKFRERRNMTQPWEEASAGCIFKNPPGGVSAGELIEEAHLKGTCLGDAYISPRHANFILNRGKAKAEDVLNLVEMIQKTIRERKGIELELEIEVI